ncbi:hypothetical protein ACFSUS_09740 [Spirosoma soli]|uniref:DUF3575 domain-containing protein n=1 Tax=Spirosoma soli TaxID=1770529 RepID=A0ABW5M3N2_9BACT
MKRFILGIVLLLVTLPGLGQTKSPLLIGIDVLKPVLSVATPNRPAFRLAELTVKVPRQYGSYLSVVGGYGQMRSDTTFRNVLMNLQGGYLKVGVESVTERGFIKGFHGLAAFSNESADYVFSGPNFGDYRAIALRQNRVAVGIEGFLAHQTPLSKRFLLRMSARATLAGMVGNRTDKIPVVFAPGVGLVTGDPIMYSVGVGVHLLYQTNTRPIATPQQ